MEKLKAIFKILFSDNYAVFTWVEAPDYTDVMSAPKFEWNIKKFDKYFFDTITNRIKNIVEYYN